MTNTNIYLVRHGQTKWNVKGKMQGHMDSPLTIEGKVQAARLKERLRPVPFDAIFSSSSLRAVTTAQIISERKPDDIHQLEALKEINMGFWEGQHIASIQKEWTREFEHFFEKPHLYRPTGQGETYEELLERALPAMEGIISKYKGGSILVVTHRMTLKTILNYYSGNRLDGMGNMPDIPPASLSKITIRDAHPIVELYGDASHYETLTKVR
ncbi:histidine phosphatase family protein [Paenibacillus dokdonensis]|uniref:histidine phosphatase family protein n=1 Tax=Paenibacillus dokdonensis TaxID=2567944 RepID=UPI0010A7CA76|nr:histidine phosphatase family protein [Paenibacillus dokdonensis]